MIQRAGRGPPAAPCHRQRDGHELCRHPRLTDQPRSLG
jgi:hypothetical protein